MFRTFFPLALLSLILICPAWSQETKRSSGVRLVSVGEITAIQGKKRTLELASATNDGSGSLDNGTRPGRWHGSARIGIGGGRGGRRGGLGGAGRDWPADRRGPLPPEDKPERMVRTTIRITGDTLLKDAEQTIVFEELRIGDRIEVSGVMKGSDIEAREIVRKDHK
jgi:hypothetical protein